MVRVRVRIGVTVVTGPRDGHEARVIMRGDEPVVRSNSILTASSTSHVSSYIMMKDAGHPAVITASAPSLSDSMFPFISIASHPISLASS